MTSMFGNQQYTISEITNILNEDYGCNVTVAAVRKWDNLIFSKVYKSTRTKTEARHYTNEDLQTFVIISIMRNIGYPSNEIRDFISYIKDYVPGETKAEVKHNLIIQTGIEATINKMKRRIESQRKGLDLLEKFLNSMQKG